MSNNDTDVGHLVIAVTNDGLRDRRMLRLAHALRKAGWEVTVLGRVFDHPVLPNQIRCRFSSGPLAYVEYNYRLHLRLKMLKFDVLCAVDLDTLLPGVLAKKRTQCRLIVDSHEYFEAVPELRNSPFKRWIWHRLAAWGFPKADQRWTVSSELASTLAEKYGCHFHVVQNFPRQTPAQHHERQNAIVYLGVLNEGRGLPELILAMHQIDAELWLLGEGDLSSDLQTLVQGEGLDHKVHFFGWVDSEDIQTYLRTAKVGVNLLDQSSESYRLSLANKFFDYIQAGLPQVCMDFPAYRRFLALRSVGVALDSLQREAIITCINQLLTNEEQWDQCAIAASQASQEWIWENIERYVVARIKMLL